MSLVTSSADSEHRPGAGLTELFREHHLELVRLALIMVGDLATAEDVVQDVFERLHRRWHRLDQPASGLAYARSSVLNACRSVHRRSAVARKHAPRLTSAHPGTSADREVSDFEDRIRRELTAVATLATPETIRPQFGRLDGSTFTPLPGGPPGLPNGPTVGAAW
jgi:DNA-directed RNA polymerase specialized sigma24 family protein